MAMEAGDVRLRGILDSAMDAIITVDGDQRVVYFNAAAEAVFGWKREEAVGAPLSRFIPARFHAAHEAHVREFGQTGATSRRMGHARVVAGLRRDGGEFPIEASISQVVERGQQLFTVILRDVTERVRAEEALRRSREELREFAMAANSVREQEKSRIARELHDELGQALTALKLDVGWLGQRLARDPEAARKLSNMQGLIDSTVSATRRISADLRPLILDDLGLVAACEWLLNGVSERTGIACSLEMGGADLDLPDPHATAVFRVLQESLTNAARHSGARRVAVSLRREAGRIILRVKDDGRGFDPSAPRDANSHGLTGLRERAYLLGGTLRIESGPGTAIELDLPAPEACA